MHVRHADLLRAQAHFLFEFPIHGLHRALVGLDATLGELPSILTNAPPPEESALIIAKNDANIRPETVPVDQGGVPH